MNFSIVDFLTHEECRKENLISLNNVFGTNILISYSAITSCLFRDIPTVLFERVALTSILSSSLTACIKEFQIVSILVGNPLSSFLQYVHPYLFMCIFNLILQFLNSSKAVSYVLLWFKYVSHSMCFKNICCDNNSIQFFFKFLNPKKYILKVF